MRCPVTVYSEGTRLNALQLISESHAKAAKLELEIRNDAGESRLIIFRPNWQLSGDSEKAGVAPCHFEGFSSDGEHSAMSTCSLSLFG
ncbi:unnamed protein product [Gongylonema pulchrum]|uniref:P/Homo B domain-containing protein n=1 Tax=Gongylonema pulchrum TaxID=637853 RepID=A0A183EXH7_9BILA|nr:unnamed protein product [Gongylonema pulchrum]